MKRLTSTLLVWCGTLALGCGDSSGQPADDSLVADGGSTAGDGGSGVGGGDGGSTGNSAASSGAGAGWVANCDSSGGENGDGALAVPSGRLLITQGRMVELQAMVAANHPAWQRLKENVDEEMAVIDIYGTSIENIATVYMLTGEQQYADAAWAWTEELMATANVRSDSYLEFGEIMRKVAITLDYCKGGLTSAQRTAMADYLASWTDELWFDNQGSGWGLADPANNYYYGFLEGTAYVAYALDQEGRSEAAPWLEFVTEQIERPGGVLDYLNSGAAGGDWHEGVSYGERSKQRMFDALSVVAGAGGTNYFNESPFFSGAIYTALYQLQPDQSSIYPGGDLARSSDMKATPYDREYVQQATFWTSDSAARGYGQWYLNKIVPDYTGPAFNLRSAYFRDFLFWTDASECGLDTLPSWYRSKGTEWINVRSGWSGDATNVSFSATDGVYQSHAHFDSGSFTMWKNGWQACDANTYSDSGLAWDAGAHNMVTVMGHEARGGAILGLTEFHRGEGLTYAQVDATDLFRYRPDTETLTMLDEYTRELVFIESTDTMVIYDRVDPKASGEDYRWRLHMPTQPTFADGRFSSTNDGGGMSLVQLAGGAATIHDDLDLVGASSDAWRVEQAAPTDGRFLNAVQVASGAAPALSATTLSSSDSVQGAVLDGWVVVFSELPRGEAVTLPFTYTVDGTQARTHVLLNLAGSVSVSFEKNDDTTKVTVAAGASFAPVDGVLTIVDGG